MKTPSEQGACDRLTQLIRSHLDDYSSNRDRPDIDGTSRLSPHLHFGEIGSALDHAAREAMA